MAVVTGGRYFYSNDGAVGRVFMYLQYGFSSQKLN